jgi:hypothetical protein
MVITAFSRTVDPPACHSNAILKPCLLLSYFPPYPPALPPRIEQILLSYLVNDQAIFVCLKRFTVLLHFFVQLAEGFSSMPLNVVVSQVAVVDELKVFFADRVDAVWLRL